MRLSLTRLWVDTDEMIEVKVALEGGGFAANQDIYVYPEDIREFGRKLQSFPATIADEAVLEVGSKDDSAYCWFKLRSYVYDRRGHSALELAMKRNGDPQVAAESRFSIVLEPASLNELGQQLVNWSMNHEDPLVFERRDA